jgi:autotransporter strand-loop-strand O-heptosyltransferase
MRIAQINPGHMKIPTNNWGAVEKIIWNYYLELKKLGHDVDIKYMNEINKGEYDIVHVHMWNHAIEMYEKGIPYVYTFHDHNAYLQGNNTKLYQDNLLAMQLAELAIVPAKFLIEYFEDVPVYLEHGIDLSEYTSKEKNSNDIKLLCVGNNGIAGNPTFDRKGFKYAIKAAEKLNLPITIVGPSDGNNNFFTKNKDIINPNVKIKYDATHDELKDIYQNNDILIHATSIEAGHPPLTILEAAACGLPVLTTDCSGDLHTTRVERDTDDIIEKIKYVMSNYSKEKQLTLNSVKQFYWKNVVSKLNSFYDSMMKTDMKSKSLFIYNNVKKILHKNKVDINFNDGPMVTITGQKNEKYIISFLDKKNNKVIYNPTIFTNSWAKANVKYFVDWQISITDSNNNKEIYDLDLKNKNVLIALDSKSLGDTLAWIPYIDEFRKKHDCKIYAMAFNDYLFKDCYPEINFVKNLTEVPNLHATYKIGWFYDEDNDGFNSNMNPSSPIKMSLQQTITDILGLDYKEIKPKIINLPKNETEKPYICIAIHSTAQSKYWNNPTGWQELVNYVTSIGYDVYLLSSEDNGYMGNIQPIGVKKIKDKSLDEIGSILLGSKLFVGIGSGLTWYSWALNVPTILISGFSEPWQEMKSDIVRIINKDVCHGCFAKHLFDRGDWNWCPEHKGTQRQFECTKSITFDMVKPHIENLLKI